MTTTSDVHSRPSRRKPPLRVFFRLVIALWLGLAVASLAARADDDRDDDVDRAIAAGEVVALERLLARIREDVGGRVLKVELERDDDKDATWIYEAKVLTAEGNVLKLDYDARTLTLLRLKGHYARRRDDD